MPYHAFSGIRDEYILHFVTNGHGFYSAGGNTWSLEAGNVFLIYPNQPVVYCADSRDPWSYAWVGFKGSRVEAILKQCGFTKNRRILKLADIAPYVSCFDLLMEHLSLELSDILFRESVLMQILSLLCLQYQTEDRTVKVNGDETDSSSYVTRAVEFITTHYMHPITISEIADFLGISKGHLNRVFQSRYGMSVQNFIIDFRMQRAAALLENTTDPVKEIALQTGYTDPLVFSKAFKKYFGVSPKAYRDYEDKIELRRKRETT
jgi:AraC-like DNA-binding protein